MRKLSHIIAIAICIFAFSSPGAEAKSFSNQFVEFQLPEKWECQLDGTEWICQSTDEQRKRDAIIVLAAKIKKEGMDSLEKYEEHLKQTQSYQSANGETIASEPRYVKRLELASHTWIDSLHLQSEIPDFYTRYLATVEADIGALLTFSVRKDKYNEYAADIEALVQSLKVFRKPGALNEDPNKIMSPEDSNQNANERIFGKVGDLNKQHSADTGGKDNADQEMMILALVVAAAIGFIIWKKKQKK